MAREGQLWDDRALLNAFDDAMSKYKKMHGKKVQLDSAQGGGDGSSDALREGDQKSNTTSLNTETELHETKNIAPIKEYNSEDLINIKSNIDTSNVLDQQAQNGFLTSQAAEDYNQLLSQYYELEDQRQKVLQQLQQLGGDNYQSTAEASGSGAQWGACSASLCNSVPAGQQCLSTAVCSCCPFVCHYSSAPCTLVPASSLCGACSNKTRAESSAVTNPDGGDVVKTAMEVAEKALSSIKINCSVSSSVEGKGESKDTKAEKAQVASSGTDITTVLNAWYTAGFYTGKYLTEQSITEK